jgi:hypothetical protein
MAKRSESRLSFAGIRIEGGLLLPDVLAKIAAGDAPEQNPSNYDIPPGLKLRDEVLRYWTVGRALWTRFEAGRTGPNPGTVRIAFARDLLTKCLEFELEGDPKQKGGFQALSAKSGSVPIIISGDVNIDEIRSIPTMSGKPVRKTPSAWLQTTLNGSSNALWGLALDGMRLRLLRDNNSLTRPAMIEVDLDRIFRDGLLDEFTVFWLLCHHTRFGTGDGNPDDCTLERWRGLGNTEGVTARDRLRDGVERALFHLGTGFLEHPANSKLRERLLNRQSADTDRLTIQDFHKQLLRLVYRLIFLMTAEDRGVLLDPAAATDAVALFRKGYSTDRLRERSRMRPAWDRHQDAFQGIRVLNRAAGAGEPRIGIPALGGIFGADQCPDIDNLSILNQRFLQAVYHLSWMEHAKSLVRINWRDMQTEELGSVYESLLELTPAITENATRFYFLNGEGDETAERLGTSVKGNSRKTTGSYYTPDSLVQLLLDRTLDPVIDQIVSANPGNPEALLSLDIIDPACGSGHFLLGAARRVANKLAELRTEGSATDVDYRQAMRDVIGHCIYGVDLNDFAIELCRVALWLESVDPGKPLEFLENHIVRGNALIGVFGPEMLRHGIPNEAYAELTGDDKAAAKLIREWNKKERRAAEDQERQGALFKNFAIPPELVEAASSVIDMPRDTLGDVEQQAKAFRGLKASDDWKRFKAASDAYVSAYFLPKRDPGVQGGERHSATGDAVTVRNMAVPTSTTMWDIIRSGVTKVEYQEDAPGTPLHWFLAFPQVFKKGGFDIVVGNPPWERIKLQEQEFFAARSPEIANAANKTARVKLISALKSADSGSTDSLLYSDFVSAQREAEASSVFARTAADSGGRYPLTGTGDVNTYALFAELFTHLVAPGGYSGMIVPTGIATSDTTKHFFADLIGTKRLLHFYNFFEIRQWFPATDDRNPFGLLVTAKNTQNAEAEYAFSLTSVEQLGDDRRRFKLSAEDLESINPNTRTAPIFRSAVDAALAKHFYGRFPILRKEDVGDRLDDWDVSFLSMFHMSGDSSHFVASVEPSLLPLYEANMIGHFDHRFSTFRDGEFGELVPSERNDPNFHVSPRYWVPKNEVERRYESRGWNHDWVVTFRSTGRSTDARTLIPAIVPRSGLSGKLPAVFSNEEPKLFVCLFANLGSIVLDYCARQKVGGADITMYVIKQIPVLPPSCYSEDDIKFVVRRVVELTYTSESLRTFATDMGVYREPYPWDDGRRAVIRGELDAFYARKYRLSATELRFILDPSKVHGHDYPSETFRVLRDKELASLGEYRTERLTLEAWDRMERGEVAASEVENPAISSAPTVNAGDWAMPSGDPADHTLAQLAALVRVLPGPVDSALAIRAALFSLEPRLLTPYLSPERRLEWLRCVGSEAEPRLGVATFALGSATGWGKAKSFLRGTGRLVENTHAGTWAPGTGLDDFPLEGWPGRARFALEEATRLATKSTPMSSEETEAQRYLAAA